MITLATYFCVTIITSENHSNCNYSYLTLNKKNKENQLLRFVNAAIGLLGNVFDPEFSINRIDHLPMATAVRNVNVYHSVAPLFFVWSVHRPCLLESVFLSIQVYCL